MGSNIFSRIRLPCVIVSGFILFVLFLIPADRLIFPAWYVAIWWILAVWTVFKAIDASPPLCYPLLITLFFIVGFPLKVIYSALYFDDVFVASLFYLHRTGYYFQFASPELDFRIAVTAALFIFGTGIGAHLARVWMRKRFARVSHLNLASQKPLRRNRVLLLMWTWFAGVLLLSIIMYYFDIGKTGISPKLSTFRFAGWCVYLKLVSFPLLWLYLWSTFPRLRGNRFPFIVLGSLSLFEILIGGFLRSSRSVGIGIILLASVLVLKIWNDIEKSLRRRLIVAIPILTVLLVFFIVPKITDFRYLDRAQRLDIAELTSSFFERDSSQTSGAPLDFVFTRVLGIESLMAVCTFEGCNFNRLYQVLFKGGMEWLYYNVFNSTVLLEPKDGRVRVGKGLGPVATLAVSGSLLFVFAMASLASFFVCSIEIYYDRHGLPAFSALFAMVGTNLLQGDIQKVYYPLAAFFVTQWAFRRFLIPWLEIRKYRVVDLPQKRMQAGRRSILDASVFRRAGLRLTRNK